MFGQCGLYPGWTEQLEMAVVRRHHPLRNESLLAFLTNFVGFLPILLETSEQAQFLVPMTLSLTIGLLIGMTAQPHTDSRLLCNRGRVRIAKVAKSLA
jgi:hypothetical protein